jgi:lipopolysaccharide export system protein LptA
MKCSRMMAAFGWLCVAGAVGALAQAPGQEATLAADKDATVITSDRLTFDYSKHYALFERNVVVIDPEMRLTADRLTVQFDESGKAKVIKAEGQVQINQVDKAAFAQVATYDVENGKIVLAGKPRVTRGRDTMEGEIITFWRDENKMSCQSRARLVIHPDKSGTRNTLLGD